MITVYNSEKKAYSYDENDEVGSGAEGGVYKINRMPDMLIKIFKPLNDDAATYKRKIEEKQKKIECMVKKSPKGSYKNPMIYGSERRVSLAWPCEAVYDCSGAFCGYTMPKADVMMTLAQFRIPKLRLEKGIKLNIVSKLAVSKLLAETFDNIHKMGLYGIDGNTQNYLISSIGWITLIDTDSYQVVDKRNVHKGNCFFPEFSPKEYLMADAAGITINLTKEGDLHILAMLIFMIIMDGCNPYQGKVRNAANRKKYGGPDQWRRNVMEGRYVYDSTNGIYDQPVGAPDYSALVLPELDELFKSCFKLGAEDPKQRPSAHDWVLCLESAIRNVKANKTSIRPTTVTKVTRRLDSCPVTMVVDVTESLLDNGAWEPLCQNFKKLIDEIDKLPNREEIDFSLVKFSSNAYTIPFRTMDEVIKKSSEYELKIRGGMTNLMDAVYDAVTAAEELIDRNELYGTKQYKPKIFILTDGVAGSTSDHFINEENFYKWLKQKSHIEIIPIALGTLSDQREFERQQRMLSNISTLDNHKIIRLNNFDKELPQLVKWISVSTQVVKS